MAQLGAVLGREFAYELLAAVSPLRDEALQDALDQLVTAGLLFRRGTLPEASYRFKHALVQDAAYGSLLKSTRQQLHTRTATVLKERFPARADAEPEVLAHHYTEAGRNEEAIPYWQRAGQRALERSAHVEAVGHLAQGLELLETLPETPERTQRELALRLALGMAMIATRGYAAPEVGQVYQQARALCQQGAQTPQRFPVLVGLWNFYLVRAELQTAHGLATQCFHLAQPTNDATLLLEAHFVSGATLFFLGEYASSLSHLRQCMALYDPLQHAASTFHTNASHPMVACPSYAALTLWLLGYPDQAQLQSEETLALVQKTMHPYSIIFALNFAGWLHEFLREGRRTQEMAEAVRTLAGEHGFPLWDALGTILLGKALCQQDHWEEGVASMRQGLTAYQATGAKLSRPCILAYLAEGYGQGGRPDEGLRTLAQALDVVDKHQERLLEAELHRLKGKLLKALSVEHHAEAEACFRQALDIARRQQAKSLELRAAMSLSRLWQQQGKRDAARELLAEVYGWFTEGFDTADLREAKALLQELS